MNKIVKQYLVPVGSHCSCNRQGVSYSQLYIPLSVIEEFNEEFKKWDRVIPEPTQEDLPPISLFDKVEKVVLETVRRVGMWHASEE